MSNRKQVDIGFQCPDTGLKIAVEICHSTYVTEPEQAMKDLAAGWDRVIGICATRPQLTQLRKAFIAKLGPEIDRRIVLCLPCHLKEAASLRDIYDCDALVFDPNRKKAEKG